MSDLERGDRIKELRERQHLSQPAVVDLLTKAAGARVVGLRGYQAWEAGGGIKYENAKVLADVFDVELDYILRGERGPTPDLFPSANSPADADSLAALKREIAAMREQLEHQAADLARQFRLLSKIFRKLAATPEFWALVTEAEAEAEALAQSAEAAPGAPSGKGGAEGGQQRTG